MQLLLDRGASIHAQFDMISQRRFRSHNEGEQNEEELKEILFLAERSNYLSSRGRPLRVLT